MLMSGVVVAVCGCCLRLRFGGKGVGLMVAGVCPVFARRGNPSLDSRPHRGVLYGSTVWISVTSPEEEQGQQRSEGKG